MAARKRAVKRTQSIAKSTAATGKASKASTGFTAEERAAMRETVRERKVAGDKAAEEAVLHEKIAEMPGRDRAMAKRLHAIITASAPDLSPKTWYGMPAYARNGKVVCFFTPASKFKSRYGTLGFTDDAKLDEAAMWPVSFALKELNAAEESKIKALVKKAVG